MPPNAFSHSLPLPRGWPRRVRSAVVQVISLARASLTMTRGWASNSMNPRLRRQAEADRLQEEIQLLREEIRIKDARMEHIEAQKRPNIHRQNGWRSSSFVPHADGLFPLKGSPENP